MICEWDLIQQTDEWFERKYGRVGGSSAGKGDDVLFLELLAAKTEPFFPPFDEFQSYDMMRGNELEPEARDKLAKELSIDFLTPGLWLSESNEILCYSPDGCTEDLTVACEIKCPGAKNHLKYFLNKQLPPEYVSQILHAFVVNEKLETMHFCSYRPENIAKMLHVEITRDSNINIGTEKRPKMTKLSDEVQRQIDRFEGLKNRVNEKYNQLTF
jgi:hypothetical protein